MSRLWRWRWVLASLGALLIVGVIFGLNVGGLRDCAAEAQQA
ncbi:MAG: hypothetical protein WBC04_21660 [Candidatus Acidiferrales bacterium]